MSFATIEAMVILFGVILLTSFIVYRVKKRKYKQLNSTVEEDSIASTAESSDLVVASGNSEE